MWYATQVCTGREEKVIALCNLLLASDTFNECFAPRCEVKKKYEGAWHTLQQLMFPGYIFLVSNDVDKLFQGLKNIPELTKILGTGTDLVPIHSKEVNFLQKFSGQKHLVEMSKGYIKGDRVVVMEGPMMGYEGWIKKIDRHKRMAVLGVEFFGRGIEVKIGLEIVRRE